jgi:hypothetical protein
MKYKNTNEFENDYPLDYYIESNSIFIEGVSNRLRVNIASLKGLKYVSDTKFPFIIKFYKNDPDESVEEESELWTSEMYYELLQTAIRDRNPFYSVETSSIVKIYLPQFKRLIENQKPIEEQFGVDTSMILGINTENTSQIQYRELVKYIDWVIEKSAGFDVSLIPSDKLIKFDEIE